MNQGSLSVDKTTNQNFLGIRHGLKDGEDLMTSRMTPPTSFDGLADDRLRQPGNGAFCGDEDHPSLPDKCHCLVGGHART